MPKGGGLVELANRLRRNDEAPELAPCSFARGNTSDGRLLCVAVG